MPEIESIPLPAKFDTSYTNPKRKRGKNLPTSLALRVSMVSGREQYNAGQSDIERCHPQVWHVLSFHNLEKMS